MELITDRTEMDVMSGTPKGAYSDTDLNRVENAVKEIGMMLSELGFSVSLKTKTDWSIVNDFSIDSWPVETQMQRYLKNIDAIKKTLSIQIQIPKSMDLLNWNSANNIERVLQTAYTRIEGIKNSYRYSGELIAGEDVL